MAIAMGFAIIQPTVDDQPPIVMIPAIYGPHATSFIGYDGSHSKDIDRLFDSLLNSPGVSTSCLPDFLFRQVAVSEESQI